METTAELAQFQIMEGIEKDVDVKKTAGNAQVLIEEKNRGERGTGEDGREPTVADCGENRRDPRDANSLGGSHQ